MRRRRLRRARWVVLAIGLAGAAGLSGCYWDPYTGYVYPYPPAPYPYGPPPAYPYGQPPAAAHPGAPPYGNAPVQQAPLPPPQ